MIVQAPEPRTAAVKGTATTNAASTKVLGPKTRRIPEAYGPDGGSSSSDDEVGGGGAAGESDTGGPATGGSAGESATGGSATGGAGATAAGPENAAAGGCCCGREASPALSAARTIAPATCAIAS